MSRFSQLAVLFLAGGSLLVGAPFGGTVAFGQPPAPITPKISTVDGVKLNATFYPSAKKNSAVVIMVHPIGEGKNSKAPEWKGMAEHLQSKDYAVITFDFRGHGDSTTVDPDVFWGEMKKGATLTNAQIWNRKNIKLGKDNDVLEWKDFSKNTMYLPTLCNDIAAVRAYLDRQNDLGECNSANILVIGADTGGTLAAIWINSEWSRFKATPNPMFPTKPATLDKTAEGNDIRGAVFLTIQPQFDSNRKLKLPMILKNACYDHGMGAVFVYGSEDAAASSSAKNLEKSLKVAKNKKHDYIQLLPRTTNLGGVKLLQNGLKTEKEITSWFDDLVKERGTDWAQRDFVNTNYAWQLPKMIVPAHRKGDKNLEFQSYKEFTGP
jgi:dienelactone hydrolase